MNNLDDHSRSTHNRILLLSSSNEKSLERKFPLGFQNTENSPRPLVLQKGNCITLEINILSRRLFCSGRKFKVASYTWCLHELQKCVSCSSKRSLHFDPALPWSIHILTMGSACCSLPVDGNKALWVGKPKHFCGSTNPSPEVVKSLKASSKVDVSLLIQNTGNPNNPWPSGWSLKIICIGKHLPLLLWKSAFPFGNQALHQPLPG